MGKSGKEQSEGVFKRYSTALKRFISTQISSTSEAEDIMHDVFYRYLTTKEERESIQSISGWLYRVARNLIIDRSRKRREESMPYTLSSKDSEEGGTPLSHSLRENSTPESELERKEIAEEFQRALSALPLEQRSVFELNELQGIPFKEISDASGIPINTLISRKRYAVIALQKSLAHLRE